VPSNTSLANVWFNFFTRFIIMPYTIAAQLSYQNANTSKIYNKLNSLAQVYKIAFSTHPQELYEHKYRFYTT
jgi:hypothetical protein